MVLEEIQRNKKIPVFGGFSGEPKSIIPNTAIDYEAELSFFIECVSINTLLIDDIWALLESDTFGNDVQKLLNLA